MLDGIAKPDGYGVLTLPGRAPLHLLLELDRDTETTERIREKSERYARAIPRGALRHSNPLVLLAVPSDSRARATAAAVAHTRAPIVTAVWHAGADTSPIDVTLTAQRQRE
jgi:hypothetical protein